MRAHVVAVAITLLFAMLIAAPERAPAPINGEADQLQTGPPAPHGRVVPPLDLLRLAPLAFGLALFTRIQRADALGHERRAALVDAIEGEPGVTFSELRQRLHIGSGSLAHHLRVLEQQGLIAQQGDGQRRRFHLRGPAVTLGPYLFPRQRTLIDALQRRPGSTPTHLAKRVGLPRHAVQYHLGRLVADGHVRRRRDGRHARYYA